jgi:hypothetical protein
MVSLAQRRRLRRVSLHRFSKVPILFLPIEDENEDEDDFQFPMHRLCCRTRTRRRPRSRIIIRQFLRYSLLTVRITNL